MQIDGVSAGYGKNIIVGNVNVLVKPGEILSLIGPNGGGKSTLLKSISGQLDLVAGSVYLGKNSLKDISSKELAKEMSIVTTDKVKPQHMTCRDVVMAGRIPFTAGFGLFREEDRKAADRAIELLKIEKFAGKQFSDLSDGQKQRTLIARAICQSPSYLIMDEPTSYLDIKHRMELMDVLKGLAGEGITIVMSIHELDLALSVSDRVLMIYDDGRCCCKTPEEVCFGGLIKDLFDLSDEMYERVQKQLKTYINISEKREEAFDKQKKESLPRYSSYFVNKNCEYYPCHDLPREKFSCMFCYCPLYDMKDCGGEYTYTEKGIKNCKNCTFPHDRDNYREVIKRLKEKMYENSGKR